MTLYTLLYFPNIDRLQERFGDESKPFFSTLSKAERKQLQKYYNFKKAEHQDNWSFTDTTYRTLKAIDAAALDFYLRQLKYKQLSLDIQLPCGKNR